MTHRSVINPASMPSAPGWSHAVRAGEFIFGSGMMATDYQRGLAEEIAPDPRAPWFSEPLDTESRLILNDISAVLDEAGASLHSDILRVWQWIVAKYPDDEAYAASKMPWPRFPNGTPYARNYAQIVKDGTRASTGIGVRELPVPGALLSVDYLALVPNADTEKVAVPIPEDMPQPRAGYTSVVKHGDWIFMSGYGPVDFQGDWMRTEHMGERGMVAPEARLNPYIWIGSEIEAQMEFTLQGLKRMAEAAGTSFDRAVKADVTLTTPADFVGMDRVWKKYFPEGGPARHVMTGSQIVLKGVRVEIALTFLTNDSSLPIDVIEVDGLPRPVGSAPQAVHAGDYLFTSSLLPTGPDGRVAERMAHSASGPRYRDVAGLQTEALLSQLQGLCGAAGTTLDNVCKVQSFMASLGHLPAMLRAWREAFPTAPPALSPVEVGGSDAPLILPEAAIQWDAIAYAPRKG